MFERDIRTKALDISRKSSNYIEPLRLIELILWSIIIFLT